MTSVFKSCCVRIPQRWIFVVLGFFGLFNGYAIRISLSITMTQMVVPHHTNEIINKTNSTLGNESFTNSTGFKGGTFNWDESAQGLILSSFYWGYTITQVPGGIIAEKFGAKYTLGIGILINGILNVLSPFGIWWGGLHVFILIRFLMGFSCGTMYPAANVMLSNWIPLEERSKAGTFVYAGAYMGTVFATSVSGIILEHSSIGWPAVFYFFGTCGIIWFVVFSLFCYDTPMEHPFISDEEIKFLHERLSKHKHKEPPATPWGLMLTSKPVWALVLVSMGHAWGVLTLFNDLNKYMNNVLKFSVKENGYLSALPYLCMWLGSIVVSCISDWLIMSNRITSTNVRKLGSTVAAIGPAIFLVGASYAGCNKIAVVTMITFATTLLGSGLPSIKVNVLDLSPNYAGSLMAVKNAFASMTGILTPCVVGLLTPNQTIEEWRIVFWIVAGVLIITNVAYVIYASGDVEDWNDPEFIKKYLQSKEKPMKEEIQLLPVSSITKVEKCTTETSFPKG